MSLETKENWVTDLDELQAIVNQSDDEVMLDEIDEASNNFADMFRYATTLDAIVSGEALEFGKLDDLLDENKVDKDVLMDMISGMVEFDDETLDALANSTGDDFTDALDIVSEAILDEYDEDIAPHAAATYGVTMDYTFYPTKGDCTDGNSDNSPIHKGQKCKITAHNGKIGYKRDGHIAGNPFKKTAQKGTTKKIANKDGKLKAYRKSMRKLGYMNNKGGHTKAFKKAVHGEKKSTSSKNRNKD